MPVERPAPASAGRTPLAARLVGEGVVAGALLAWWLASRVLPDYVLPGPVAVAQRLFELFTRPEFLAHTLVSTVRVFASVAIAVVLGTGLALAARTAPWVEAIVDERIRPVLNSFPSIGWAILAAIWFDVGSLAVIFVQVAILVPFCLVNVAEGLRAIDRELLEMGRSFSRSRWRGLRLVTLPLLMPYLLAAVRISYGIGWKIALVSELVGAPSGLGYLMLRAQTTADSVTFLAACLAIVMIFTIGDRLVIAPLERRFAGR
ncbi:MAG: ABC transporter permease [Lautropia sp.]